MPPFVTSTPMRRAYTPGPDGIILGSDQLAQWINFYLPLTSLVANGNIVTGWVPGFRGRFLATQYVVHRVGAGAGAAAQLNLEINGVDVTGGVVALTLANTTPAGVIIPGSAITGRNDFDANDLIDIELSGLTVFTAGDGQLMLKIQLL